MKNFLLVAAVLALSFDAAYGIICYECQWSNGTLVPCEFPDAEEKESTCAEHVIGCVEAVFKDSRGDSFTGRMCLNRKREQLAHLMSMVDDSVLVSEEEILPKSDGHDVDVTGCIRYHATHYWGDICFCDTEKCNKGCPCNGAAGVAAFTGLTLLAAAFNRLLLA